MVFSAYAAAADILTKPPRVSNTSPYSEVLEDSVYEDKRLGDRAGMRTASPVLRDRFG
jgi:hypothetical protein